MIHKIETSFKSYDTMENILKIQVSAKIRVKMLFALEEHLREMLDQILELSMQGIANDS